MVGQAHIDLSITEDERQALDGARSTWLKINPVLEAQTRRLYMALPEITELGRILAILMSGKRCGNWLGYRASVQWEGGQELVCEVEACQK